MRILQGKRGVQVLFRHMPTQLVDMRYVVRVGAVDEQPHEEGYCHALEHMLYAGTSKRDWQQLNRDWERHGGWANAYTHLDTTGYYVTCLKKYWKECFEVLADMLYNPTFPEERWEEVEKSAVISEIQSCHDDEDWLITEETYRSALGKSYHGEVGDIEIIRSAKMSDLKKFYDEYYRGSNVVLLITGDLTEDQVLKTVNKYDRLVADGAKKRKRLVYNFDYKSLNIDNTMEQSSLMLFKPAYMPRTLRSKTALELGTECLSQYLFEELREKRGLCYGASAGLEWSIPNNVFMFAKTSAEKKDFRRIEREMKSALERFTTEGLTSERVENMKLHDIYNTAGARESISCSPGWMWDAWEEQVYSDPFDAHVSIVEALDASSVRRTVSRAFRGKVKTTRMQSKD